VDVGVHLGMPSSPRLLNGFQKSMAFLKADIILYNIMESVFENSFSKYYFLSWKKL
jgi:hypothetical protein